MKFTAIQKARLKALLELETAKDAAKFKDAEKKELKALKEAATAVGFDYMAEDAHPDEDFTAKAVTETELDKTVKAAVDAALEKSGLSVKAITEALKKDNAGNAPSAEQIQQAVSKALEGQTKQDPDALKKIVEEAIKNAAPQKDSTSMTMEQVKALVGQMIPEIVKQLPGKSRMEHEGSGMDIEFPIAHRTGNLSVAMKQLLNACMNKISSDQPEAKQLALLNEGITEDQLKRAARNGDTYIKSMRDSLRRSKALTTTGSGSGLELMPVDLSATLQMRLYMESDLAREMVSQEIDMPTDPFKLPLLTTRTQFFVGAQGVATTESSPGTANPTLTTGKLMGMANYTYEADEDSIVAILPMITMQLSSGAADAYEGALINGDTGTHQDSDIRAVSQHSSKLLDGLRKLALAGGAATSLSLATGGITAMNIAALRKLLKKYGLKPKNLLIICGTNGYNDLVTLTETLTAEKMGNPQAARIISGDAPALYGIPIIPSAQMREDLNASGVYDGVTTNRGSIMIVNRTQWITGVRRQFMVEVWVDKPKQLNQVIASFRRAFIPLETPGTAVPSVALGYAYNS